MTECTCCRVQACGAHVCPVTMTLTRGEVGVLMDRLGWVEGTTSLLFLILLFDDKGGWSTEWVDSRSPYSAVLAGCRSRCKGRN